MIDCQQARALLSSWLDHQLPDQEKDPLMNHLESCGNCATLERTCRATIALSAWPAAEIPVPVHLGEALLTAIRAAKLAANPPAPPENKDENGENPAQAR
jgi:anti-sigma factor RsiW